MALGNHSLDVSVWDRASFGMWAPVFKRLLGRVMTFNNVALCLDQVQRLMRGVCINHVGAFRRDLLVESNFLVLSGTCFNNPGSDVRHVGVVVDVDQKLSL